MSETQRIQAKWSELQDGVATRIPQISDSLANGDLDGATETASWFSDYRDMLDLYHWYDDLEMMKAAHFGYADDVRRACENYDPDLIELVPRYGYLGWVHQLKDRIRGADILDIGCGNSLYGIAFLIFGARSYTGVDPSISFDEKQVKNKNRRQMAEIPISLREMTERNPAISLVPKAYEDFAPVERFSLVSLHNVTEHLHDIDAIIPDLRRHIRDDGTLVYLHHNYYSWNGHHGLPRTAEQIDMTSNQQRELIDWNHVLNIDSLPRNHFVYRKLNRIRFDELKRLTCLNFDIEEWIEKPSPPEILDRLTPELWDRLQAFDASLTRTDLTINLATCVATPKPLAS